MQLSCPVDPNVALTMSVGSLPPSFDGVEAAVAVYQRPPGRVESRREADGAEKGRES